MSRPKFSYVPPEDESKEYREKRNKMRESRMETSSNSSSDIELCSELDKDIRDEINTFYSIVSSLMNEIVMENKESNKTNVIALIEDLYSNLMFLCEKHKKKIKK